MDIFVQQIINGLVLGSIYALVALGYTMVYGIMGLINFAHGEVVMIGAMVALFFIKAFSGLPVVILLPLALAAAASSSRRGRPSRSCGNPVTLPRGPT